MTLEFNHLNDICDIIFMILLSILCIKNMYVNVSTNQKNQQIVLKELPYTTNSLYCLYHSSSGYRIILDGILI